MGQSGRLRIQVSWKIVKGGEAYGWELAAMARGRRFGAIYLLHINSMSRKDVLGG